MLATLRVESHSFQTSCRHSLRCAWGHCPVGSRIPPGQPPISPHFPSLLHPIQNLHILLGIHDTLNLYKHPNLIPSHTVPYHDVSSSMLDSWGGGPVCK